MPLATSADPGSIILGPSDAHVAFKLAQAKGSDGADLITVSQLSAYQPGVTIGATDVNSHPVLATWGISDLTGGHGLANHQAGVTDQRYRYGTLDVSRPGQWAGRWKVNTETGTAGAFMPLGDLLYSGNIEMYGSFGTDLHVWNESTDAWTDTTANLAGTPVNPGVAFKGTGTLKLFIPTGSTGYSTYTGATKADVAASGSTPAATMFCVFGGTSLVCLDTVGQLWHSEDGSTWASFSTDGKVDESLTAYGLRETRDAMGNPVLILNTSGGAYTFDPAGPTLYPLDLKFPTHPYQGRAAAVWRGDYFISVGMGVHSYTGGNIGAMGLDRDEGIPYNYSKTGRIVSFAPEYNSLYALTDAFRATVQRWDGFGWHSVWEASVSDSHQTPSKIVVSSARGNYRLWWGHGTDSLTIELPIAYNNPRQVIDDSLSSMLESSGYFDTGMTNMGMPGSKKIAVALGVRVEASDDLIALDFPVTASYRTVEADWFTDLSGPYDENGTVITPSGTIADTYFYWFDSGFEGVTFDEIELRITSAYANYVVIKWVALYFMKVIAGNLAWTVTLDLTNTYEDQSPAQMNAALDSYITSENIVDFIYRDTTYKVRVASWSGADSSGRGDDRGMRSVQLIQVKDRP